MAANQKVGLLMIPDISGFTEFVSEVEISHSEHIITELLGLLIDANNLGLHLCEIEGDALFFYREGALPTLDELNQQAREWYTAFHSHLRLMKRDTFCKCGTCQNIGNLGLKMVCHSGEFAVYNLKDKSKVIGKDVILVHRLLKNEIDHQEYMLLSSRLMDEVGTENRDEWEYQSHQETYPILGEVPMVYVDLSPLLDALPPTPDDQEIPDLESSFSEEVTIQGPFAKVVEIIMDIANYPTWVAGLQRTLLDASSPIRPGHHHICEFPGQAFSITIDQIIEGKDEIIRVDEIKPPPILKRMCSVYRVRRTSEGTKVRQSYLYDRKPIVGRIFDIKGVPPMREGLRQSLQNLKLLVESNGIEA